MKNNTILCLLAVAILLVTGCATQSDLKPARTIQPFTPEMLDQVNGISEEKPIEAKSKTVPEKQIDSNAIAELKAQVRELKKNQTSLKKSVEVNETQIKQNEKAQALLEQNVSANTADVKQIRKAVNELSLMVLLNRYKKGNIAAFRYHFAPGSNDLSKKAKNDLAKIRILERQGKVKVCLFEGYSSDTGSLATNKQLADARANAGKIFYAGDNTTNIITASYAEVNFHGFKKDNSSMVVYVEVLVDNIDLP